jgi:hypothetical protein
VQPLCALHEGHAFPESMTITRWFQTWMRPEGAAVPRFAAWPCHWPGRHSYQFPLSHRHCHLREVLFASPLQLICTGVLTNAALSVPCNVFIKRFLHVTRAAPKNNEVPERTFLVCFLALLVSRA